MKIIWMINGLLPQIAKELGLTAPHGGGWTYELSRLLSENGGIELSVFYPQNISTHDIKGVAGRIRYFGFYEASISEPYYDATLEARLSGEIKEIDPDIVHIWGAEFTHSLAMLRAFGRPEKTVISIQGLIHCCACVYTEGLPDNILHRHTLRDLIRHDSIYEQKQKFLKRGENELAALTESKNVIGRTEWDRKTINGINPKLNYHHCGEILRKEYYGGERWSGDRCEKHSIFISQAYYPIKGIHFALRILKELKQSYKDVKLYVAGKSMFPSGLKERLKQDYYSKYICGLIEELGLKENVFFTGALDASEMKERYLRSNVYLQASVLENSPNSLGEAMILGVPCVASNVGGTPSMLRDKKDGFLYPLDRPEQAAMYISEIFEAKEGIEDICGSALAYARSLYDREKGFEEYLKVYNELYLNDQDEHR